MPPKKRVKAPVAVDLVNDTDNDENEEPTVMPKTVIMPEPRLGRACKRTVAIRKSLELITNQSEQACSSATTSEKTSVKKPTEVSKLNKKKLTSKSASNILENNLKNKPMDPISSETDADAEMNDEVLPAVNSKISKQSGKSVLQSISNKISSETINSALVNTDKSKKNANSKKKNAPIPVSNSQQDVQLIQDETPMGNSI